MLPCNILWSPFTALYSSQIHSPLLGDKVNYMAQSCRTGPPRQPDGPVRQTTHAIGHIVNFTLPVRDYELSLKIPFVNCIFRAFRKDWPGHRFCSNRPDRIEQVDPDLRTGFPGGRGPGHSWRISRNAAFNIFKPRYLTLIRTGKAERRPHNF